VWGQAVNSSIEIGIFVVKGLFACDPQTEGKVVYSIL
jgi:hypothetical protein